jgi:tripartite-type tricarboxylate transporter receptor subunit TctC
MEALQPGAKGLLREVHRCACRVSLAVPAALAFTIAGGAQAALALSEKPVRLVVPSERGARLDLTARTIEAELGRQLDRRVVIEHRPGADGKAGSELASRAAPDGHTILLAAPPLVIDPSVARSSWDPMRSLRGVTQLTRGYFVLLAHPSVPATTPAELVNLARQRPRTLTLGSGGRRSPSYLAGELLAQATGIEVKNVRYESGALDELANGHINVAFDAVAPALSHVRAGRLRALANASSKRSKLMPDLPALGETFAGVCIDDWHGALVPAATPGAIVQRLQRALATVLALPEVRQRLTAGALDVVASDADDFDRLMLLEYTRFARLIGTAHTRPD